MDRISDLPDEIIIKILSFLSIDKGASTSILSKRWRDLFAFTPKLCLSPTNWLTKIPLDFVSYRQKFIDFVERMLAVSGNSPIRRLCILNGGYVGSDHTKRWIRNVLKRGGVLVLHLHLCQDYLLFEVFACKTLVKLKLTQVDIHMLPEDASFPALKYLSLYWVKFHLETFEKLISACSLLEELICFSIGLEFWKCSHFLSGPTLKRLNYHSLLHSRHHELGSMSFDHPNLVYLDYTGYLERQYPVVNLDSLVKANIVIKSRDPGNCDPSNLIKGLKNVKIFSLSFPKTLEIFGNFHEVVPVFENLTRLSINVTDVDYCSSLSSLPFLLKKCPNLQTLVIKGSLCGHDESKNGCKCFSGCDSLLLSCVKVLELTACEGSTRELEQIKRFLEELACLELVIVSAYAKDDKERLRITTDLRMLLRASSKCKIQFQFS